MTWIPCCRQPLSESTRRSPSGEETAFSGMLPASKVCPAGSRQFPVGKQVCAAPTAHAQRTNRTQRYVFIVPGTLSIKWYVHKYHFSSYHRNQFLDNHGPPW